MEKEEGIKLHTSNDVFYNPQMRFCRSMSSLAVGAIGGELELIDAFCASGIRGIRYAKENSDVSKLTFLDIEKNAIRLAKKNARANKVEAGFLEGNISRLAFEADADFLEIDPFGTPSPYLLDGFRFFNPKKVAYLSATATDVAVLCGGKTAACLKNYHSKPLNNEFTHETGLRILIKRIAEVAAEFNMGVRPLVSFSDRHYLKTVVEVRRSADLAFGSMKSLGHVYHCPSCGFRGSGRFPVDCPCGRETGYAGPLWLGELHDKDFLGRMTGLNQERDYSDKAEMSGMLGLMAKEIGMPPYYYNIHELCKIKGLGAIPKKEAVISSLERSGFRASGTHFSPISIKTDAPVDRILEVIGWKG